MGGAPNLGLWAAEDEEDPVALAKRLAELSSEEEKNVIQEQLVANTGISQVQLAQSDLVQHDVCPIASPEVAPDSAQSISDAALGAKMERRQDASSVDCTLD